MTETLGCDQRDDGRDKFVLDPDFWLSKQAPMRARSPQPRRSFDWGM
jgi:hypothetical protein